MADPIQSGIDTDYGQYQGGDVGLSKETRSALGTDMSDPVSKYFKQMTDYTSQERKTAQEAQKDIIGKQIQMEQNRLTQEADLARRQAGQMSGIMSQYGKQLMAEPPKRQIEKDTMEGMIGIGALLPVAGAFFGGKGLTGATGALNAMAGLVKGYQEGNKQRIDFEQKKYDDAMKEFDRHQRQIKDAFDLAIKGAQVNQTAALAELKMKLYAENAPMLAELAEKQGIVKTANDNIQMYNNFLKQRMQYESRLNQLRPAMSKVGQQMAGVLDQQNPQATEMAVDYINKFGITENEKKIIPAELNAIKIADDTARYVAQNQNAIGPLAQAFGKIGEPSSALIENLKSLFSSDPSGQKASQYTASIESKLDKELDSIAASDPSKKDDVAAAKIASKKLFSLALADAVAVGRPTVFLERALSSFYSPSVTPSTLVEIIKSRAEEADLKLPRVFKAETLKNPPPLLTMSNEDFMRQGQPKSSRSTRKFNSLDELKAAISSGQIDEQTARSEYQRLKSAGQ